MAMKREVRDRWVAALRSGDYSQGTGYLCDREDNFCCLGVFNDVMGNEYRVERDGARAYFGAVVQGWSAVCNKGWLEEQGLRGVDMQILVNMNDTGSTFEKIADWIERSVEVEESPSDGL